MKHLFPLLLLLLCSCRTVHDVRTEYVERADTVWQTKWRTDSVHVYESRDTYQRGDTLYIERQVVRYKEKTRTDTLYLSKTETQTLTEFREVEVNRLRWWQKGLMWTGAGAVAGLCLWFAVYGFRRMHNS